jgi:hypothetical protein
MIMQRLIVQQKKSNHPRKQKIMEEKLRCLRKLIFPPVSVTIFTFTSYVTFELLSRTLDENYFFNSICKHRTKPSLMSKANIKKTLWVVKALFIAMFALAMCSPSIDHWNKTFLGYGKQTSTD